MSIIKSILLIFVSSFCLAHAVVVTVDNVCPSTKVKISYQGIQQNASIGVYHILVDGELRKALRSDFEVVSQRRVGLCYDSELVLRHSYTVVPIEIAFGESIANDLSLLWAIGYRDDLTIQETFALQLAMWEIIGGNDFHYYVIPAERQAVSLQFPANGYAVSQETDAKVRGLFSALASYNGEGADLMVYTSPIGLDFIAAVPEPQSSAWMILSMLGVYGLRRQRGF